MIFSVENLIRAIVLQTEATTSKKTILRTFSLKAVSLANSLLKQRTSKKLMDLHRATYLSSKENTSFGSQVICDIERYVCKSKAETIKAITVKCNVPRNAKAFKTVSKDFVELALYPRRRIAIPFKKNPNWQRYSALLSSGWTCKTYGLTSDGQIVAYLSKEKEIVEKPNVLGIDINAKHFAISVVSPEGKVLYQTYLGRYIYARRRRIMERRAMLQSYADTGSIKAAKKLVRLRHDEQNFVKTNLGQMIAEIMRIAKRFNAEVATEDLKRFKTKGRKFNKIVMRIPFYKFKEILSSRCFDNNIPLKIVDSWHTSKFCYRCGAVGKGHSANYSLFKCKCGFMLNADRKASVNIAVKSLLERNNQVLNKPDFFLISNRRVFVNGLMRSYDDVEVAVHKSSTSEECPAF
jgi:IS605 OrfB family transposase